MASKEKVKKSKVQLPLSIISHYKKYRNTNPSLKTQIIVGNSFEIDDRYEIIDMSNIIHFLHKLTINKVGQGAYGTVVACKDHKSKDKEINLVAIKKIEKAFEHRIFAKRTLRELKILRILKHENVLYLKK